MSIAQVNLKLIWDVVSKIKVGERGRAYVVDADGRLIAHPDISLVLRNTDMSKLAQVRSARAGRADNSGQQVQEADDIRRPQGAHRLCAGHSARLAGLRRNPDRGGLCAALCVDPAHRLRAVRRARARLCRRHVPGRTHGGADPGAAAPARRASAAAISASASTSKPATRSRRSPISSTTWRAGCRNPMPTWSRRSKTAPASCSELLEDLRTAQDRLVQTEKLASLGQLTAGIAHEIKNPLNFVNNFSGLSVELVDELQESLAKVTADDKTRADITEVADTLKGNLEKIVQHGKRADSIVKNMLLHSREGSGEHRPVDINAVVEESLNLAYHGARAEKQGFNITLERVVRSGRGRGRSVPAGGHAGAAQSDFERVLCGDEAQGAVRRRDVTNRRSRRRPKISATAWRSGFATTEPAFRAEVKEKMFNPFFTTKPAGRGDRPRPLDQS